MLNIITHPVSPGSTLPDVLHLGCGSCILSDAVNVDTNISMDIKKGRIKIPANSWVYEGEIIGPQDFPKKHFKRIEACMVLEHIHPDLIPNLLYCLCNFLQDNGVLIATVPNFSHITSCISNLSNKNEWAIKDHAFFRELNNELMCPNMCGMGGHQSVWIQSVAKRWLNAEGFMLAEWKPSANLMHVTFKAVKLGGDHASAI